MDIRNNFSLLYDFYIVAKEKNVLSAAQKNSMSQPNLSRNIKKLENIFNQTLINRTNKGIKLTNDGERLYKILDEMFNNLNNQLNWNEFIKLGKKSNKTVESVFEPNKTAIIIHTGGSTGVPKGVKLTNENFNGLIYQLMNNKMNFRRGTTF